MRFDELDGVFHSDDFLGRIVRDLAAEFLFERHHELDRVETVGAKIIDEAGALGHLLGIDAEMLDDDFPDPFSNVANSASSVLPLCRAAIVVSRLRPAPGPSVQSSLGQD